MNDTPAAAAKGVVPAGRFAPSPTGPLHIGSLYVALASFLDARAGGYAWRIRFDDLDTPRNAPGAVADILRTLEAHHLGWDGAVHYQSQHQERYQAALTRLRQADLIFYCTCSRRTLAGETVYPGLCRSQRTPLVDASIRVQAPDQAIHFEDAVQGAQSENMARNCGDFLIKRRDGPFAYQLAAAVDDGDAGIQRVVRGRDLLSSTPRQLYLMDRLGLCRPTYAHLPLLMSPDGRKWSTRHRAPPLDTEAPARNLSVCLGHLGMQAPDLPPEELIAWAVERWPRRRVQRQNRIVPR